MTKTSNRTDPKLKLFCSTITRCLHLKTLFQDEEIEKVNCWCPSISLVSFSAFLFPPKFQMYTIFIFLQVVLCFVFEIKKRGLYNFHVFLLFLSLFSSSLSLSKSLLVAFIKQPTHFPISTLQDNSFLTNTL